MNKAELTQSVHSNAKVLHQAQLRPSTFVHLVYMHTDNHYEGVGFAEIHGSDKWDSQYEYDLARKKAVAHIVRQIMRKCERYE